MTMLPSNTEASAVTTADTAVNGIACNTVNGTDTGTNDINGSGEACLTPVTDPDSIALLAAMHEANRFVAH